MWKKETFEQNTRIILIIFIYVIILVICDICKIQCFFRSHNTEKDSIEIERDFRNDESRLDEK